MTFTLDLVILAATCGLRMLMLLNSNSRRRQLNLASGGEVGKTIVGTPGGGWQAGCMCRNGSNGCRERCSCHFSGCSRPAHSIPDATQLFASSLARPCGYDCICTVVQPSTTNKRRAGIAFESLGDPINFASWHAPGITARALQPAARWRLPGPRDPACQPAAPLGCS